MLALAAANFLTVQHHVRSTVDVEGQQLVLAQARALGDWVETKRLLTHTLALADAVAGFKLETSAQRLLR